MKVLRLLVIGLMTVVCASALFGQGASSSVYGNIYGRVTDESGGVLPGVTVTLTGVGAPQTTTSGSQGEFRFLNLSPGSYMVKTELSGFATIERSNVSVGVGMNTEITVPMKVASVATTITVTSESPLLDTRKETAGSNFNQTELKEIPSARDPWVVMQQVPGVQVDRVNVAGSESGQQAGFIGKGSGGAQNAFQVDGVTLTDMSALGSSSTYYDFDAFQEMQVTTGGSDAGNSVPGVTINMVTKRGTNDVHGSARVFETPRQTEARPILSENGHALVGGGNSIDHIQDYGVEAGGPIWPDKAWLWGSYGRQQIDLFKIAGGAFTSDKTTLENYAGKLNIQPIESNSFTLFYFRGDKLKFGRGSAFSFAADQAPETLWNQHGPTTIWKGDDSQVFGPNLVADVAWSYVGTGFELAPIGGLGANMLVDANGTLRGSYEDYSTYRPQHQVSGNVSGFFNTGSLGHELKFGFGYRKIIGGSSSVWPGDQNIPYYNSSAFTQTGTPFVKILRNLAINETMKYANFSLADTITAGNLTMNVGVRYDDQQGQNTPTSVLANATFPDLMPAINYAGGPTEIHFKNWEPRVGLTYALGAQKKTLLRASYARFADQLGSGTVAFDNPLGYAYQDYYFTSASRPTQPSDLGSLYYAYGVNPACPGCISSPNVISSGLKAATTDELIAGIDHELLPNLVVGAAYTYRHRKNLLSTRLIGVDSSNYILDPTLSNLPAYDQSGNPIGNTGNYYYLDPNVAAGLTNGRLLYNNGSYSQSYNGVELQVTKRLSDRWMFHFGGNYNIWKQKQDNVANGCVNPNDIRTNTGPGCDDGALVWVKSAGSGSKGDVFINGKWNFNISGLYQLPLNFNVAANFFARQGYLHAYSVTVNEPQFLADGVTVNPAHTAYSSQRELIIPSDNLRYANVYELDLRVEKVVPLFQKADLALSIDIFNALNDHTILQQSSSLSLRSGGHGAGNRVEEVQSPRALRFGARLSF